MSSHFRQYIITFSVIAICSCSTSKIPKETRAFVKVCSDSINNARANKIIPTFLSNPRLDHKMMYWIDMHHPLPLRKMIVDRIKKKEAINYILSLDVKNIDSIGGKPYRDTIGLTYYTIPYLDKSFADLLRDRLSQLNK
jgi:hypothetical protein